MSPSLPALKPMSTLRQIRAALLSKPQQTHTQPQSLPTPTSPLSSSPPPSPFSAGTRSLRLSATSFGSISALSFGGDAHCDSSSADHSRRIIRPRKSIVEVEQEEERWLVGDQVVSLVEPRPSAGPTCASIEEILGGSV